MRSPCVSFRGNHPAQHPASPADSRRRPGLIFEHVARSAHHADLQLRSSHLKSLAFVQPIYIDSRVVMFSRMIPGDSSISSSVSLSTSNTCRGLPSRMGAALESRTCSARTPRPPPSAGVAARHGIVHHVGHGSISRACTRPFPLQVLAVVHASKLIFAAASYTFANARSRESAAAVTPGPGRHSLQSIRLAEACRH